MEEAHALAGGNRGQARAYLHQVQEILAPTGAAETATLAAELEAMTQDGEGNAASRAARRCPAGF